MEVKTLELRFKNDEGKEKKISIRNPKLDLESSVIQPVLEAIVNAKLFGNTEGMHYAEVVGARYVTRTVLDVE